MKIGDPNCERCKLCETTERVCVIPPLERNKVMVVGEAPGANEEKTGKLFSGEAGRLLDEVLKHHGLDRKDIIVTNAVSCRPPGNRTPKKAEIKACRHWLHQQLEVVKPKFVLILGNTPLQALLDLGKITKLRGKPIERDGIIYMPTYHPAFVLRDMNQKETFSSDIRLFAEIVRKGEIPKEEGLDFTIVKSRADLKRMMDDLYGSVSFDIETTGLYPWAEDACINTLGFGTAKHQWILPAEHKDSPFGRRVIVEALEEIEDRIHDGEIKLVMQNGKFDSLYTWVRYGVRLPCDFDTMVAHYLLDENSLHGLKYLSKVYFGAIEYDVDDDTKFGRNGIEPLALYQAHDLYYTRKLKFKLTPQLDDDPYVRQVFDHILMPCVNLFTEIENNGVYLNLDRFDIAEKYLLGMKADAERNLKQYIPADLENMNWGSPKQLGDLLFGRLGIKPLDKTAAGKNSTSESVLKRIDHPMVESLLKFREAKQQLSFFIEGWKPFLDGKRLHPSFKLTGTVTGRLSCEHPNLQQVPRDPRIRSLIGAPPGWTMIECDLSQIELRIAAELSNDRGLVHAFHNNIDVHWYTCIGEIKRGGGMAELILAAASYCEKRVIKNYGEACEILILAGPSKAEEFDPTWKELRKKAKAINFGYLYGMWWKKFKLYARDNYGVKVTDEEAQASRIAFFAIYSDLPEWHKAQKLFARRNGYVRALSGRKRRLPDAMSKHDTPERGQAERQAINSPVQSFASDLNLMAIIQVRKEFSPRVVRLVAAVHDAILMEVRNDYVEKVFNRTLEIMSHPELLDTLGIDVRIPIEAEGKIGDWSKGVSLKKWKAAQNG